MLHVSEGSKVAFLTLNPSILYTVFPMMPSGLLQTRPYELPIADSSVRPSNGINESISFRGERSFFASRPFRVVSCKSANRKPTLRSKEKHLNAFHAVPMIIILV